jgi:hypothetical protein
MTLQEQPNSAGESELITKNVLCVFIPNTWAIPK